MKNYLLKLDKNLLRLMKIVGQEASIMGCKSYVVGGFVRDLILKRKNLDLDVTVEGDAIKVARKVVSKLNAKLVAVHERFGTATIKLPNNLKVDFAKARKEEYPYPGSLPVVQKGAIDDDLFRRDFTVNAMAVSLAPENFGALIDKFNGLKDLRSGRIRVLHDKSFIDDPTRILRAVRFEQRFGFKLERQTCVLLKAALKKNFYKRVKAPRYFAEFQKVLSESSPKGYIIRLKKLGALKLIHPTLDGNVRLLGLIEKNRAKVERKSFYMDCDWWVVCLMAILFNVSSRDVIQILKEAQVSKYYRNSVLDSKVADLMKKSLSKKSILPSQVFEMLKMFSLETVIFIRTKSSMARVAQVIDDYFIKYRFVEIDITGKDLQKIGIPKGKKIGEILKSILLKKIDGKIKGRLEQLEYAKSCMIGVVK